MAVSLFSAAPNAQTPSIKADWSDTRNYSVLLSSYKLEFTVPGKLSSVFEFQAPKNSNIYDESLYGTWTSFSLSSMYWDYKARKLLWSDLYGSMRMHIIIQKNPDHITVINLDDLKQTITSNLRVIHGIRDGYYKDDSGLEIPDKYDIININDNEWLKFNIKGGESNEDKVVYAAPLGNSHVIEVHFSIIESKPRDRMNWFSVCMQDIDQIIRSFKLQLTNR